MSEHQTPPGAAATNGHVNGHAGGHAGPWNPTVHFEQKDVDLKPIVTFVVCLFIGLGVVMVGTVWFFDALRKLNQSPRTTTELPLFAEAEKAGTLKPPEPRLEGIDLKESLHDVGRIRLGAGEKDNKQQQAVAESFGWVNQKEQIVRIPVNDAMAPALKLLQVRKKKPETGTKEEMK